MPQQFSLVLIKPWHYDNEGYVIQWFRSAIPSNSLAIVPGLALDYKERRMLGDDRRQRNRYDPRFIDLAEETTYYLL